MSTFVMRNRPKKPKAPEPVTLVIEFDEVTLEELSEYVEKFRYTNELPDTQEITLSVRETDYGCYNFYLFTNPISHAEYQERLDQYKRECKEYDEWRRAHQEEIAQYNEELKERKAKSKLLRQKEQAQKKLEEIDKKLRTNASA